MAIPALQAAVSGAQAAQTKIDTIANNIANINTTGYKKSQVQTSDLFYLNLKRAGVIENAEAARRPVGVQVGLGAKVTAITRNMEPGALRQTMQPLDIAILNPSAYFAIILPNGRIGYTRDGSFKRDAETGAIVTADGNHFARDITIDENIVTENITISKNGVITVQDPDNPAAEIEIDQIELFTFPNERGLQAIGDNMFEETLASGGAVQLDDTNSMFQQGWLEQSNVKAIEELVELVEAQRHSELNSRVIRVVDEIAKDTNNIK